MIDKQLNIENGKINKAIEYIRGNIQLIKKTTPIEDMLVECKIPEDAKFLDKNKEISTIGYLQGRWR